MRLIGYILLILLPTCVQAAEWDMITVRNLYYKAALSKTDSENLKTILESIPNPNECIKGYIGASYMIEAKHAFNPANKLSYFNNGKNILENAIKNDPGNIELKFLRICIQSNAPSLLGYNMHIETDKKFILLKYALNTDLDLKKRIKEFMSKSSLCTEEEKKAFN